MISGTRKLGSCVGKASVKGWIWSVALVVAACVSGFALPGEKQVDPFAQAGGKPVVLIFVRSDCPISNRYAPTIQRLAAKYAGQVTFWLVYPSKDDSEKVIAKQTREYGYKLATVADPEHVLVQKAK